MKYHQRDIVEVSFLFPDGTFKPHPAIIESRIDEMAHHIAVNEGLENAYVPLSEQDIKKILMESL